MINQELILDQTDLRILRLLQENARISNVELARQLQLAPSAMLERVKKLEAKNAILSYSANINPVMLNQGLLAFIFLKVGDGLGCSKTSAQLIDIPEIQEVHHIAGDDCYLLKVRTADSASLMDLMRNKFSKIPHILSTRTTIVLETVKENSHINISV